MDELDACISRRKLDNYKEALYSACRESIALNPAPSTSLLALNASKLGGKPAVPAGFTWPTFRDHPLQFICQVNLEEINRVPLTEKVLPERGLMSFFCSPQVWGFDIKDKDGFKVYHFDCPEAELQSVSPPGVPDKKVLFGLLSLDRNVKIFKECLLMPSKFLALPDDPEPLGFSEEDFDNYFEMLEDIACHHRMLGFAEPIQGPMEIECEMISHGLYLGDAGAWKSGKDKELEPASKQWRLLLQVDSDRQNSDMMWGDAGRLYFWIKEADLRQRKFENCWYISQCH